MCLEAIYPLSTGCVADKRIDALGAIFHGTTGNVTRTVWCEVQTTLCARWAMLCSNSTSTLRSKTLDRSDYFRDSPCCRCSFVCVLARVVTFWWFLEKVISQT